MEKKNIDWANLGFGYVETDKRFVSYYKDGAWDEGALISDPMVTMSECACVLQYAQTCFEGMKAYTTEKGQTVVFRPDLNADRMADFFFYNQPCCCKPEWKNLLQIRARSQSSSTMGGSIMIMIPPYFLWSASAI